MAKGMREKTMTLAEGFAVNVTAALTAATGGFFRGIWKLFPQRQGGFLTSGGHSAPGCGTVSWRFTTIIPAGGEVGTYALSAPNELYRLLQTAGGHGFCR